MNRLSKAFKELQKVGYIAKRKMACCRSCAWDSVPDKNINLVVFTTKQSDDAKNGIYTLYWSAPDDNPSEILEALRSHGLKAKKPKDARTAIEVRDLHTI